VVPPARPTDPQVPARLGSYELLELLGQGGMGEVYRARHVHLDKLFAVKVVSASWAEDPDLQARFRREVLAAGRLEHPNLVRATDAGEAEGRLFLAMELLEGEDLYHRVQRLGPLPVAEACAAVRQAALGLDHAHHCGLVHRDVKPHNLFWTTEGVVKVLDLGLARLRRGPTPAEGGTSAGTFVGTADYAAPEQFLDASAVEAAADIYSLGCTLFHLLSGSPPFGNATHHSTLSKAAAHLNDPPPDLRARRPEVPETLAAVVYRMLAKKPQERPTSAAQVAEALAPFTAGQLPPAVSPTPRPQSTLPEGDTPPAGRIKPQAHRFLHGWRLAVAAVLVLVAGVAGGWRLQRALFPGPAGRGAQEGAELQVRVWRPQGEYRPLRQALPVRTGDEVQVRFRVPASMHATLFLVNGQGKLQQVELFPPAEAAYEAVYPGPNKAVELRPPAGTELFLVCGRPDRPVTEEELRTLWEAEGGWPSLEPPRRLLRLRPDAVVEEGDKPRDLGEVRDRPESDGVPQRLERLRERLREAYPLLDGLAFRHD
jgi:hypothetical protein